MATIAFLVKKYPKSSETFIHNQIVALEGRGHDVDVYAQQRPPVADGTEATLSCNVTYLDSIGVSDEAASILRTQLPSVVKHPSYLGCVLTEGFGAVTQCDLWKYKSGPLLDNLGKYDAIHAHYGPVGNGFQFVASMTDAPFVTSFYGYDASELLDKNPWRYESLFRSADAIASLSSHMDGRLADHGCPRSKLVRFPLPVDTSSFRFSPVSVDNVEVIELLSACRLVEKKGLKYALEAVDRLRNDYRIRYRIAGDGPLRSDLERKAHQLGIDDLVSFLGWKDSEEVAELMADSHIFVQPSVTSSQGDQEGTPTVLLEAQARGMPVVSTYHAGIPEIVEDGSSGRLVPERDVDSLASALDDLCSTPSLWSEYGRIGRELVENRHSLPAVAERLELIYRESK